MDRIVIVGTGECGARAARELRSQGFVGSITMIGAEIHPTYERPPLSKAALINDEVRPAVVLSDSMADELDIEILAGAEVVAIDRDRRSVALADGQQVAYDRLLLATGARARTLPIAGGEHARTLRTIDDAVELRHHLNSGHSVVVIGAGFIGLEVAASARTLGCSVTVLEVGPRVLGRAVPAEIAAVIEKRHTDEGVEIMCDVVPAEITSVDDGFEVHVDGFEHPIHADLVVAGVGAVPNVELAESAGLAIDNGIAVDEQLRTDDPRIFAAGDCCSAPHPLFHDRRIRLESWRNAHDQAVVAATNLLGGSAVTTAVPWFWSDQYELGLQLAGLADEAATTVVRNRGDGTELRFGVDDGGRLVSAAAVGPGTSVAKDIRLAEMMIAAGICPSTEALADPAVSLKKLLKS